MLKIYLSPVSVDELLPDFEASPRQWGRQLQIHDGALPDLDGMRLALVGVEEDRRQNRNAGCKAAPDAIRRQLYRLYNWEPDFGVADLGNIKAGRTRRDTYVALENVVAELLGRGICPIVLGGTHDVTYGQFLGHGQSGQRVNVAVFDEKIDLFADADEISPRSFLYKMLTQSERLFNFVHAGHQRYLVDPNMVDTLEELHFECYSLGELRSDMEMVEPILRDAGMLSFDLSAVRQSDAPGVPKATPNGFTGEEACRVFRYAGMSNHVSSVGIYQFDPAFDRYGQTAQLAAQMIWYFVNGHHSRRYDEPEINERNCHRYIVYFEDADRDIVFLKSKLTDRWWMKVPSKKTATTDGFELLPCSYSDYLLACKEEIPERWMKAFLRLN